MSPARDDVPAIAALRAATRDFARSLAHLPPDMRVLAASEALADVIAAAYPWRDVADVAERTIDVLPRLIAEAAERANAQRAAAAALPLDADEVRR